MPGNLTGNGQSMAGSRQPAQTPAQGSPQERPQGQTQGQSASSPGSALSLNPSLNPWATLDQMGAWQGEQSQPSAKAVRWPPGAMPLSVVVRPVQDAQDATGSADPLEIHLMAILCQWIDATAGNVMFDLTVSGEQAPETADILVEWSDKPLAERPNEVGHAERTVSAAGQIQQVIITLVKHPTIDQYLPALDKKRRFEATVLHEFGHALGLEHSNSPLDVMFHQGWRNARLGEGDVAAVRLLYP